MALTITNVQNFFDTDNQGIYNTDGSGSLSGGESGSATYQLVAGRHYFVQIAIHGTTSGNPTSVVFDPDGTPLSLSVVSDGVTDALQTGWDTDTAKAASLWHVHVSANTAVSFFRITLPATQSCCSVIVFYVEGEDDTGLIVQVVKATGTSTTPAVTMASFAATDNGLLFAVFRAGGSATDTITPTESRSELSETMDTERSHPALHYQLPNGGDTSVNASIASAVWCAFGVELKAGAAAAGAEIGLPPNKPFTRPMMGGYF